MSIVELSVLVIAFAAVVLGAVGVVLAVRVAPLIRTANALIQTAEGTLRRLNAIAAELEAVARDARQLESRVSRTVGGLLDQAEPPLRIVTALLAGTRAGVGSLFSRRR